MGYETADNSVVGGSFFYNSEVFAKEAHQMGIGISIYVMMIGAGLLNAVMVGARYEDRKKRAQSKARLALDVVQVLVTWAIWSMVAYAVVVVVASSVAVVTGIVMAIVGGAALLVATSMLGVFLSRYLEAN